MWGSVLLANSPQLLLSVSYFVYNSLFTRLQVEKEWNRYSKDYRPLRVTAPVGEQVSTYRLQLPYRYSIPLITISIILHWLVSNTLYVFIIEGGKFPIAPIKSPNSNISSPPGYYSITTSDSSTAPPTGLGLSDDAYIGIGFSSLAILTVFILACVLVPVPIALCIPRIDGDMVIGGSNSRVISAACHAPPSSATPAPPPSAGEEEPRSDPGSGGDSIELDSLLTAGSDGGKDGADDAFEEYRLGLVRLSRGKVRWGVVPAPESFGQFYAGMGRGEGEGEGGQVEVGHLSFGAREHDVQPPVAGKLYA